MALNQVFALTPRNSYINAGTGNVAGINCWGVAHLRKLSSGSRFSFDHEHSSDELFFYSRSAEDDSIDYTVYTVRQRAPHIHFWYDLSSFTPHKEVALTFRFDTISESRILVYSDAGILDEEILHVGDNQFLVEVETTDYLNLYFIHANRVGSGNGGNWFFQGIDGYIA